MLQYGIVRRMTITVSSNIPHAKAAAVGGRVVARPPNSNPSIPLALIEAMNNSHVGDAGNVGFECLNLNLSEPPPERTITSGPISGLRKNYEPIRGDNN